MEEKSAVNSVFIIDDDKIYRFTTEKYIHLLKLAKKVSTYADGEEALNHIKDNIANSDELPDVILLDVNMPIMDGWDFIEEYISLNPQFPKPVTIYMVSSSIDERDRERAHKISEISAYIVKPITEEQLVKLIKSTN